MTANSSAEAPRRERHRVWKRRVLLDLVAALALSGAEPVHASSSASGGRALLSSSRRPGEKLAQAVVHAPAVAPGVHIAPAVGASADSTEVGAPPLLSAAVQERAESLSEPVKDFFERRAILRSTTSAFTANSISLSSALGSQLASVAQGAGLQSTGWAWTFPPSAAAAVSASVSDSDGSLSAGVDGELGGGSIAAATSAESGTVFSSQVVAPAGMAVVGSSLLAESSSADSAAGADQGSDTSVALAGSAPANRRDEAVAQKRQSSADEAETTSSDSGAVSASASTGVAYNWLNSHVNLYRAEIAAGSGDLSFVNDPASASSSSAVLSVAYAKGSFGLKSTPLGGASFYSQPFLSGSSEILGSSGGATPYSASSGVTNDTDPSRPQLLLTYSVYFPANFDFVQGGKLPGLYSSVGIKQSNGSVDANTDGCSGGAGAGAGQSCWSTRVMWRTGGIGEVYAYIPTKLGGYSLCANAQSSTNPVSPSSIICNSDYGTSIGRGSFYFKRGQWTTLSLYVQVNTPNLANGVVQLYVNGSPTPAVTHSGLVFRSGTVPTQRTGQGGGSAASTNSRRALEKRDQWTVGNDVWVDKAFFSTFFGGSDASYAATANTNTYFKNFSLFAGQNFPSRTGQRFTANGAASVSPHALTTLLGGLAASVLLLALL